MEYCWKQNEGRIPSVPQTCTAPVPPITPLQTGLEPSCLCLPEAVYQNPTLANLPAIRTEPVGNVTSCGSLEKEVEVVTKIPVTSRLAEYPAYTVCPSCRENVVTLVVFQCGILTWLLCFITALLGGLLCCCCFVPFCINEVKDADHYCPRCNAHIFKYKRLC
ncbi:hypothetical protein GDO86_017243 [Hymenochirus boettgeri]|uniref:LITAF domain-containing protein n=1 Tax=Hymenochirus boettgeri TaxID=247094 RepID=A0A8T2IPE3_9PIPI|nr:hypothetical protein GDO86_017243 [Hymenochirus boettgeri]